MAARKLRKAEHLASSSRYQLLVHLASGGMGAVYLGIEKTRPNQVLAIKRAHSHLLEDASFRKMFAAEARLASLIRHPNAIGVIDVDESDGELLMVMPYLEGGSLGDMLVAGYELSRRVPPAVALRIVIDAARGLQAAHELTGDDGRLLGIVHRDVSPQNILVGVTGTAAIVDFGVAKAVAVESNLTATGVLKGKTAYMAPEYIGKQTATPQADVFSLGVVCWEALANRRLFKGESEMETMQHILGPKPAPMLTDETATDANVAAIVARALVKDPTKRFHTAAEFADALERRAQAAEMLASPAEVAASVKSLLADTISARGVLSREALRDIPGFDESTGDLRSTKRKGQDAAAQAPGASHPSFPGNTGLGSTAFMPPPSAPTQVSRPPISASHAAPAAPTSVSGPFAPAQSGPSSPMRSTAMMAPGWQPPGLGPVRPAMEPTLVEPIERSSPAQATLASVVVGSQGTPTPIRSATRPRVALWAGAAVALAIGISVAVVLFRPQSGTAAADAAPTSAPTAPAPTAAPTAAPATAVESPGGEPSASAKPTEEPATATVVASATTPSPPSNASAAPPRAPGGWRPKANPYNQ